MPLQVTSTRSELAMIPNEHNSPAGHDPRRGRRFELFFFEQVGSRSYLRFTNLALFLIVFLTVVPMAAILTLFLWNRSSESENINVNIVSPASTPQDFSKPIIQRGPLPPPPPEIIKPRRAGRPPQQMPPWPSGNDKAPSTPNLTPLQTPTRTPS
jgi:hypothetical protein